MTLSFNITVAQSASAGLVGYVAVYDWSVVVAGGGRWMFNFEMKFYPTEPATLHEDLTRSEHFSTCKLGGQNPVAQIVHRSRHFADMG